MKNAGHHGDTGLIQLAIRSFLNTSSFSVRCSVFGVTDLSSVSKRWLALMAGLVVLRYLNFQWMMQNIGKILHSLRLFDKLRLNKLSASPPELPLWMNSHQFR
jgi:hypothetical protein